MIVGIAERAVPEMVTPDAKVLNLDMSGASSPAPIDLNTNITYHEWFTNLYKTHRATLIAQAIFGKKEIYLETHLPQDVAMLIHMSHKLKVQCFGRKTEAL